MPITDGIAFLKSAPLPQQIASPTSPKIVSLENGELSNTFLLAVISGSILLLYSLSRIIALHRRVKDLEARPPVDDIVMRGLIRSQLNDLLHNSKKEEFKEKAAPLRDNEESEEEEDEMKSEDENEVSYSDSKLKLEKRIVEKSKQQLEIKREDEETILESKFPKLPPTIIRKKIEMDDEKEEEEEAENSPKKNKKSKNTSKPNEKVEFKNVSGKKRRAEHLSPVKLVAET
jgi:hypothetical protein